MSKRPNLRIVKDDGVASEGELQADYEATLKRTRAQHGPAASTIAAFKWLVAQNDPARLKDWLDRHDPDEVAQLLNLLGVEK
jgi:hypothetical protein